MKKQSKAVEKSIPLNTLIRNFFHSIRKDTGKIEWQGVIIGSPEPGWYLVLLFDWLMGNPNLRRLVRFEDMEHWLFYDTAEMMRESSDYGVARVGGPYRDKVPTPTPALKTQGPQDPKK